MLKHCGQRIFRICGQVVDPLSSSFTWQFPLLIKNCFAFNNVPAFQLYGWNPVPYFKLAYKTRKTFFGSYAALALTYGKRCVVGPVLRKLTFGTLLPTVHSYIITLNRNRPTHMKWMIGMTSTLESQPQALLINNQKLIFAKPSGFRHSIGKNFKTR